MDLVTPAYRVAAGLARRAPGPVTARAARRLGRLAYLSASGRRAQVERNLRRVDPTLSGRELDRLARHTFESYARYYEESFRLPDRSVAELDAGFTHEGFEHLERAIHAGTGAIMAMPHLGGWEWSGFWLTRVQGIPASVVVGGSSPRRSSSGSPTSVGPSAWRSSRSGPRPERPRLAR